MIKTGLVSVTFRKLDKFRISSLVREKELEVIEWGGDIHVPPADTNAICNAVYSCRVNGVGISSYGSYYRCDGNSEERNKIIETSCLLGAECVRIWAGKKNSGDMSAQERKTITDDIRMLCTEARRYGLTICPELHIDTLTDNYESALRLLDEVGEENFRLYWQPNQFRDDGYNLNALKTLIPFVTNIHVFHWIGSNMYPLIDGEYIWKKYIEIISSDCNDHNLLLEFVCDGSTDQFRRDADTLKHWIGK